MFLQLGRQIQTLRTAKKTARQFFGKLMLNLCNRCKTWPKVMLFCPQLIFLTLFLTWNFFAKFSSSVLVCPILWHFYVLASYRKSYCFLSHWENSLSVYSSPQKRQIQLEKIWPKESSFWVLFKKKHKKDPPLLLINYLLWILVVFNCWKLKPVRTLDMKIQYNFNLTVERKK